MATETTPVTDIGAAFLRANELYIIANKKKADVGEVEEVISTERVKAQKAFDSAMGRANTALETARQKAAETRDAAIGGLADRSNAAQAAANAAWNDLVQFQTKFHEDTGYSIDLTSPPRERKPGIRL